MIALPPSPFCQTPDGCWRRDSARPAALLCGAFNPLHAGHLALAVAAQQRLSCPVAFELTAVNADKPPLDDGEIRRRLRQFEWQATVWLTHAASFAEKARLFPSATFVVGFDTAERVLQPRFYGDEAAMAYALDDIRKEQCRFLVAGRLLSGDRFQTFEQLAISEVDRDLFDGLSEGEFRLDLSATQIRAPNVTV